MSRFVSFCVLVFSLCLPALADLPVPVATLTLPPPGNSNAFDISARYDSAGLLYVWDGLNLWKQYSLNSSLTLLASNLGSGSADAGPINFSNDGSTLYFGNGAGGMLSGASNGLIYSFNLASSSSQLVSTVKDHLDFIPLPALSSLSSSSSKLLVNSAVGWTGSQVSIASVTSSSNTPVISNIPGAATSLAFDSSNNLYVGVGYGADRGDIRKFSWSSLQAAYLADSPIDWTLGTLLNPSSSNNNSGAGMFFDSRGYLFVGGNEGLTVFGPDGIGVSYDLGPGYSRLVYNAAADQFLVLSYSSNNGAVYNASAFVPEPGSLLLLPIAAGFLLRRKMTRKLAGALLILPLALNSSASGFYAEKVIDNSPGANQSAYFNDPSLLLGAPKGAGDAMASFDVYNLGVGGAITLGFDNGKVLSDLPGTDFIVFENPIAYSGNFFAELMFVEVSSDGVNFARFPTKSLTPSAVGPYGTINPANVSGFAGVHPVYANPDSNTINPFDPTVAGGDAFDLSALLIDPLVQNNLVNLNAITQIRLIDILGDGTVLDSSGKPIYDATGAGTNGADLDAIAILHTVPEPGAMLLPALSLFTLLRRRN
jgi:hypothetical protein